MMPTDQELGFDPNGPGQWHVAVRHPLDAMVGVYDRNKAVAQTDHLYPNDPLQNDEADAFRHAFWSYLMTKSMGAEHAKQFTDAHEISVPNPIGERYMDLYNNRAGRNIAGANGNEDAVEAIRKAIRNGKLRLSPY